MSADCKALRLNSEVSHSPVPPAQQPQLSLQQRSPHLQSGAPAHPPPGRCRLPPGLGAHRARCRRRLCQPPPRASTELCWVTLPLPGRCLLLGTEGPRGTRVRPWRERTVTVHLHYCIARAYISVAQVCHSPNIAS